MNNAAESRHRVFGFFRAPETASAFVLLLALAFFWTWSHLSNAESSAPPSGPLQLETRLVSVDEGFFVEVTVDRPAYVTLLLRRPSASDVRVFPRLGPPMGLPWPLRPGEAFRLPGGEELFRKHLARDESIIVLARSDRLAEHDGDLPDDEAGGARFELKEPPR